METSETKKTQSAKKNSMPQSKLLVIERDFNVPVARLFAAFTKSEILKIWWWPSGLYADQIDLDFRQGGRYFINMKGYDKGGGGMTGQFEEIVANERIVMTDQFANEKGQAISAAEAQMPGEWPELAYITLEFESMGENTSLLRLSQQGIPNELQQDCIQGWSESFDKLEEYLAGSVH